MGDVPHHVVIPVANERANRTLPLAIETIRHHTDYEVVTIGHDFGVAEHIAMDQGRNMWANTDRAMRLACERFDQFIWSNDDIYWMCPATPARWAIGDLTKTLRRGIYGRRKDVTLEWLTARKLPTWDYEAHVPMLIDSAVMLRALTHVDSEAKLDKRTIYGNLAGEPDVVAPDVKLRAHDTAIPRAPWVASHDECEWDLISSHIHRAMGQAQHASI